MPPEEPIAGSVADWLRHARADLALARSPVGDEDLPELHCFHAQQAVEKALKAVLLSHGIRIPRTHVIQRLLDLLPTDLLVPSGVSAATSLTLYAQQARYPGTEEEVSEDELEQALSLAVATVTWAGSVIAARADDRGS